MTDPPPAAETVPEHWWAFTNMMASIRSDADLDPVIFELCRLQAALRLACESELAYRYQPAVVAGLTEEKVEALPRCHESPLFSERERACLRFAEQFELDPHSITDEDYEELERHMPGGAAVAFVHGLTALSMTSRFSVIAGSSGG